MNDAHRAKYQPISEALDLGLPGLRGFGRFPGWMGYALAELALVTDGERIEFVDGQVSGAPAAHVAELVVFTRDGLRIEVTGSAKDGVEQHETVVRSRAGLRSATVSASASALGEWPSGAPGRVTVDLECADGTHLRIPRDEAGHWHGSGRLAEFLPSLLADLEASPHA